MPLFEIKEKQLKKVTRTNFRYEKELQTLVEKNLEEIFNCRFVATEFPTGSIHAGRIDTLALSEENNPVIIEYKKVESSELINQSLYYLSWIYDHKGDFEIAVQRAFGKPVEIDWTDIRIICIAPNYKKYDLHAVKVMGANIELWSYRYFKNGTIYFEEIFQKSLSESSDSVEGKNPVMVAAGKKAALVRQNAVYTYEEHLHGLSKSMKNLVQMIREFITKLDASIEEVPKKFYIAYRISQNIVCVETRRKGKILLYLKLDPKQVEVKSAIFRDVSKIGHYGTGDVELTISSDKDFEKAKPIIQQAYENVGG